MAPDPESAKNRLVERDPVGDSPDPTLEKNSDPAPTLENKPDLSPERKLRKIGSGAYL